METGEPAARRVLIADDHPLYREALRAIVPQAFPGADIREAASSAEVATQLQEVGGFDLIVLDLKLPGATGLSCLRQTREAAPLTPVIVVSANDDPATMSEVVIAGAAGYVPKAAPRQVLLDALRAIMGGGTYLPAAAVVALRAARPGASPAPAAPTQELTARQMRVLKLLAQGLSNKRIARELEISEITVKAHVSLILKKLNVANRVQAAIEARKLLEG
ncbi:MAG: response regulator transcription factor [Proteobacteria bacterium]|nr:response regulator transcription factor [Pseudomonadota bacterium]